MNAGTRITDLSNSYLGECFVYDSSSGVLTWKHRPARHFKSAQAHHAWNTRYAGKTAGCVREDGYTSVRICGRSYLGHRIGFALYHGLDMADAPPEIDHKDTDASNGDVSNLRPASHAQNLANQGPKANNTSGFKGVSWDARHRRWHARIRSAGKRLSLGYFANKEAAHEAYRAAAATLHGEFARAS